jgi:hypothetical protein
LDNYLNPPPSPNDHLMHVDLKLYTKCFPQALNLVTKSMSVIWQVNNQTLVVLSLYVDDSMIVSHDLQY